MASPYCPPSTSPCSFPSLLLPPREPSHVLPCDLCALLFSPSTWPSDSEVAVRHLVRLRDLVGLWPSSLNGSEEQNVLY
ncbi:hypothetical protein NC653_024653 [Populus alba x Populus x berolinensis]|uniref:Uncharacterized protein n=1 Tax=Populus alba x Populus x berolinensis TaxID=444605 RepID=A0AAD6M990_9ROSI|nr:hypothetical protein NC653_024653 [Populus alba x Populus x berolinensis]